MKYEKERELFGSLLTKLQVPGKVLEQKDHLFDDSGIEFEIDRSMWITNPENAGNWNVWFKTYNRGDCYEPPSEDEQFVQSHERFQYALKHVLLTIYTDRIDNIIEMILMAQECMEQEQRHAVDLRFDSDEPY